MRATPSYATPESRAPAAFNWVRSKQAMGTNLWTLGLAGDACSWLRRPTSEYVLTVASGMIQGRPGGAE